MAAAALELRRNGRVLGRRHAWQILLDGKPAGSIADDDAARLPAEPAPYPCGCHQDGSPARSGPSTPPTGRWSASPATRR
jgi:hypothetical protein